MESVARTLRVALVIACVIAAVPVGAAAQAGIPVRVTGAVDTKDPDKKDVLDLWVSYLNSNPGAMWSDPNWGAAKSDLWLDIDLTAQFVYGSGGDQLLQTYTPTVLAIEKEGSLYSIRTMFYAEGLDSLSDDNNPWAIVRVYAQRENGRWMLRSALGVLTEDWNRPAIGKITFVSPASRGLDIRQARRAVAFCDSISGAFPFFQWDPFSFYITERPEEVDRIIGLEYDHEGYPKSRVLREYDILITGKGSEWEPDELVRMVATGPGLAPHRIVRDGFAGWLGGWDGKSYARSMRGPASVLGSNEAISFGDFLDGGQGARVPGSAWFPGAVVCNMVFDAAGASGIETLFKAGRADEDLYRAIEATTGMDRRAFQQAWRRRVLEFSR
jgi:hypothetical protein